MKTLPKFVHNKNYSKYFLFDEMEIIRNNEFSKKLKAFSDQINGNCITIELELPKDAKKLIGTEFIKIQNNKSKLIDEFYDMEIVIDEYSIVPYYVFNFHVYDETNDWELYCSFTQEIAIIGCNNNIIETFTKIIKPYGESSLDEKLDNFDNGFINEAVKKSYIKQLVKNYNLK